MVLRRALAVLLRWSLWIAALLLALELFARLGNEPPAFLHAGRVRRPLEQCIVWPGGNGVPSVQRCTNAWGLSGPMPAGERIRVIALGSSTTECPFLPEEEAWPVRLQAALKASGTDVWVGNGGVSGSTTFGNAVFLEDHLLGMRPDVVLFMPGANDRRPLAREQDSGLLEPDHVGWKYRLLDGSRALAWIRRMRPARARSRPKYPEAPVGTEGAPSLDRAFYQALQPGYRDRVLRVVDTCVARGVRPVLITQPLLASEGSDEQWVMDVFNSTVRDVAAMRSVPLIDLAKDLPQKKDYYFDGLHFSANGTRAVCDLLLPSTKGILQGSAAH